MPVVRCPAENCHWKSDDVELVLCVELLRIHGFSHNPAMVDSAPPVSSSNGRLNCFGHSFRGIQVNGGGPPPQNGGHSGGGADDRGGYQGRAGGRVRDDRGDGGRKDQGGFDRQKDDTNRVVHVYGINDMMDDEDVIQLFQSCGKVDGVAPCKPGSRFVTFSRGEEATNAIQRFDGRIVHGRRLDLTRARKANPQTDWLRFCVENYICYTYNLHASNENDMVKPGEACTRGHHVCLFCLSHEMGYVPHKSSQGNCPLQTPNFKVRKNTSVPPSSCVPVPSSCLGDVPRVSQPAAIPSFQSPAPEILAHRGRSQALGTAGTSPAGADQHTHVNPESVNNSNINPMSMTTMKLKKADRKLFGAPSLKDILYGEPAVKKPFQFKKFSQQEDENVEKLHFENIEKHGDWGTGMKK